MSSDYGTIMESIMCEHNIPMLKDAVDVYTQYENEVLSLARKHRLCHQEVSRLYRKLSERLDVDSNIFHHKLDFECYCYAEKKQNPNTEDYGWLDNIIKNMIPNERFEFIEDILNESLKIKECTKNADSDNNIPKLKKQIKYCKNPLERKSLKKQLNFAYRERKNKDGNRTDRTQKRI